MDNNAPISFRYFAFRVGGGEHPGEESMPRFCFGRYCYQQVRTFHLDLWGRCQPFLRVCPPRTLSPSSPVSA